ncbi:hypothetical protein [Halonotius sp. GCM10025705]|uniref:hypothetical protein n=1 Tax=Halonotius sp. GCM10025705 TaxID=3252678 RepID=UPI00361F7A76
MSDSELSPVAFDIETSGFEDDAVITAAGFSHTLGESLVLNTAGRDDIDRKLLVGTLDECSSGTVQLDIVADERELLDTVASFATEQLDGDRHYLTAFNGETWNGGFDLPFCRTRFLQHDMSWPFGDLAYADMMQIVDRFDTKCHSDLVGVYDALLTDETCAPFEDSEEAVAAFEASEWLPLLKHNLADVQRTRELARLAGRFVPKSDFSMKNLQPPNH